MTNPQDRHRDDPVILFRSSIDVEDELKVAAKYFRIYHQRSEIPYNAFVVGRYSVLPYYKELCTDLGNNRCVLANTFNQHRWIADFQYYEAIEKHTFKTYFDLRDIPEGGSYVVKGKTNSRKAQWNTKMFAPTRRDAIEIATELMQDPLLQQQGIIVREYVPLELIEEGLNGQPFVNEHRFFFANGDLVACGFYWSQCSRYIDTPPDCIEFAKMIAKILSIPDVPRFYVIDVAKTAAGEWKVVELNDGQMAGLSTIDHDTFYLNLYNALI